MKSQDYRYAGSDNLEQVGWYKDKRGKNIKPLGLQLSNELGIYDMNGNVNEWCEDNWHLNFNNGSDNGSAWS